MLKSKMSRRNRSLSESHTENYQQGFTQSYLEQVSYKNAQPKMTVQAEKEGFDCGKCGARCAPTSGQFHNISPHLFCFYVEHDTTHNMFKVQCEADRSNCKAKLETSVTSLIDKFLTSVHLTNKFTTCNYCLRCFQKYAPEIAKNEANNVCRYYDIGCQDAVFIVD